MPTLSAKQNIERAKGARDEREAIIKRIRALLRTYENNHPLRLLQQELKERDARDKD